MTDQKIADELAARLQPPVSRGKNLTDKEALQALQRGETLGNLTLGSLHQKELIEVQDVTDHDIPLGQRELLFIRFTDRARRVLEG